jgi:shikimate kinase
MKEEIVKVLSEREPLYAQVAILEIDTEGKQTIQIADEIATLFTERCS